MRERVKGKILRLNAGVGHLGLIQSVDLRPLARSLPLRPRVLSTAN